MIENCSLEKLKYPIFRLFCNRIFKLAQRCLHTAPFVLARHHLEWWNRILCPHWTTLLCLYSCRIFLVGLIFSRSLFIKQMLTWSLWINNVYPLNFLIWKIVQPNPIFSIIRRILPQTNPSKRNCHGHEPYPIPSRLVLTCIPCAVWHRWTMRGCIGSVPLAARIQLPRLRQREILLA